MMCCNTVACAVIGQEVRARALRACLICLSSACVSAATGRLAANSIMDIDVAGPSGRLKYDALLSMPMDTERESDTFERAVAEVQPMGQRFQVTGPRSFERQYAQLYFSRLMLLYPEFKKQVERKWPGVPLVKILAVGEDREVVVIGTLYKDMKLKPTILDEYAKDPGLRQALGPGSCLCSDSDGLVLEDDGARMSLTGDPSILPVEQYVTGVVVAIRGQAPPGGDFVVSEVMAADLPPQMPLPAPVAAAVVREEGAAAAAAAASPSDKYLALVSGLQLASSKADHLQVQLLVDYLTGNLGSPAEQQAASRIAQLVVAGGSLGALEPLAAAQSYSRQQATCMEPVRDMDMIMTELAAALPVTLLPGAEDPANVSLPQQPLHAALFPGAAPYSSFSRATNPWEAGLDGVVVLGSAGQNVEDVTRYSRCSDRLSVLESMLRWRHMAPTAPDTLACYPFADNDPFILHKCPHVFFAGNQPAFETRLLKGDDGQVVRLVGVPSFLTSGTLVLVNLRTLAATPITFKSS